MVNFIIYRYNDMAWSLVYGFSNVKFDFFTYYIFTRFGDLVGHNLANNIYILLSIFFLFITTYFIFRRIDGFDKLLLISFSVVYTFSIYLFLRVISFTPSLYFIFFFPVVVSLLMKNHKAIYLGLMVLLFLILSNYYGFFTFVLVWFWYLFDLIYKKITLKEFIKKIFLFITPILIGILIFFFPIFKSNLPFLKNYTKEQSEKPSIGGATVYRPIEDWYNLSFRPWYFFIPPKSSIFFGELSKNIHEKIQNTGHYLADDYMEEEMAGSYMGWHFLIGLGVVATLLLIRKFKGKEFTTFKSVYENREMIYRSFFIIFCILLISGPPSFTIKGIKIYTPTYLLYYIVPVFRTLVRWAVVIYLFVLITNSFLVQDLYNLMKNKFQKVLFTLAFLTLNFVIFAIKIPVININKPPQEIAFVKEKYPESVHYAVYPKGDYYSIFWIISHEDLLINPVNFVNYETGFNSNEFSKKLITQEGIKEFLKHNPKYLIYYPENISDKDLEKINKINNDLRTKEDIRDFFKREVGTITYVGNVIIFEVR